ncbi:MAG: hypothetical protein KC546_05705, partial [Anaerolineae bacterium]|nr:hypothetical protein [Anaerolineae bacterium]
DILPTAIGGDDQLRVIGCTEIGSLIILPAPRDTLSGEFVVFGAAFDADMTSYSLSVRPDWADVYTEVVSGEEPVRFDEIATIDTMEFGKGVFWLQVKVNLSEPDEPLTCEIPVYFG